MQPYQSMQESQPLSTQPTNREAMVYPTNTPITSFYGSQPVPQVPRDVSSTAMGDGSTFITSHVISGDQISGQYSGEIMAMASAQSLHRQMSVSGGAPPRYDMITAYGPSEPVLHHGGADLEVQNQSSNLDVVFPNQRPPPSRRGPFRNNHEREETAQTRRIGSCIRCRMQRIRVSLFRYNPPPLTFHFRDIGIIRRIFTGLSNWDLGGGLETSIHANDILYFSTRRY
jgi:hypothetical protein